MWTVVDGSSGLVVAGNRGIYVGLVYAVLAVLGFEYFALGGREAPTELALWVYGGVGLLCGTIASFSVTERHGTGERDLGRNAADAIMWSMWCAVAVLAANAAVPFTAGSDATIRVLVLLPAALVGGLIGEPVARFFGRFSIGGRHPFLFVTDKTEGIANADHRFVVRVVVQSLVLMILVTAAVVSIAIILTLLALMVAFWFIGTALDKGGSTRTVVSGGGRRAIAMGRGTRIKDDGRIVKEGLLWDTPTGMKMDEDGRMVKEGLFFDDPTGMRVKEDGRVVKEGLIFDDHTGVKLESDGHGGTKVVKEGLIFDTDTGHRIGADGRVGKQGLIFDSDTGFAIGEDGEVVDQ